MNNIRIMSVTESSFEDSTYWVEYECNKGTAYDLIEGKNIEDVRATFELLLDDNKEVENLVNKPCISNYSKVLKEVVTGCFENDMYFMGEYDITDKELSELEQEIKKLKLDDYIDFWSDDETPITAYGGIITKFTF